MSSFVLGRYQDDLIRLFLSEQATQTTVPEKAKLFRGLADPTRLQILEMLAHRAMSTPEVAHAIDETVVAAAAHLACLGACGLIRCDTRDGERHYAARESVARLVWAADAVLSAAGSGIRACSRYAG